jgi:hypothetical protein
MSVEFEGDQHQRSILYAKLLQPSSEEPSLINWLVQKQIAKTSAAANHILAVIMVISFILTGYELYQTFFKSAPRLTTAEKAQYWEVHITKPRR